MPERRRSIPAHCTGGQGPSSERLGMIKAAIALFVYALLLVGMGLLAYRIAPPEANALTALIVPSVAAVLALASAVLCVLGLRNRKLGMIGAHAGLALPILFALAFAGRAFPATTAYLDARAELAERPSASDLAQFADAAIQQGQTGVADVAAGMARDSAEALEAVSKDYLIVTLWSVTALSLQTFVVLLMLRPKPAKAED